MKIYSDNAVSSTDLTAVQKSMEQSIQSAVDAVDAKQNRQIRQLRTALWISLATYLGTAAVMSYQIYDLMTFLK